MHGFHLLAAIDEVDATAWDGLHGAHSDAAGGTDSPATLHAYLQALEHSGCVGGDSGWLPRHASLWQNGELIAALPLYLKAHSYGEYVFDWAWADAYRRHGLAYYPKWLAAIPFTPIPGVRLRARDAAAREALIHALMEAVAHSELSSFHLLFPAAEELAALRAAGMMVRQGVQFHWQNPPAAPHADFDAFLAALHRDKRKKIRQERKRAQVPGLTLRWLDGQDAQATDWAFFYRCYANTYARHRSTPYLNPAFFQRLAQSMGSNIRLLLAEHNGEPAAAAFFLCDSKALYGRYWGATQELPFLHFELCYYQPIEYCIAHGLTRFEGGAQGEHKLARGLQAVRTYSAHWIADPRFRAAVDDFLARERRGIGFYVDELNERSPFRLAEAGASIQR